MKTFRVEELAQRIMTAACDELRKLEGFAQCGAAMTGAGVWLDRLVYEVKRVRDGERKRPRRGRDGCAAARAVLADLDGEENDDGRAD